MVMIYTHKMVETSKKFINNPVSCEGELINMTRAWDKEREVMGSIPVGDSEFFFVPGSCHVD